MITRQDIEIMAPVGCYESLYAAIEAGANSIYFGVEGLNMRSKSSANFTLDDLAKIVAITKEHSLKSYLTVNTVLYDEDVEVMRSIVDQAKVQGVTAIIASDQAAILYARSIGVEVHISTQLNVSNVETLRFYAQWADVVVLARELSLAQVARIHKTIEAEQILGPRGELIKIEMFAHGALCMAVSGKCYLSLHETSCSANRGACRQICRRSYVLTDVDTGEQLTSEGNYLLSPKDLCTISFVDKFIEAGVRVLKIEGRARSAEYVKRVCESYNEAIEAVLDGTFSETLAEGLEQKLATVFNRGFWGGYYLGQPVAEISKNYGSSATRRKVYVGKVTNFFSKLSVAEILIEATTLDSGDDLLFLGQTTGVVEMKAEEIFVDLKPTSSASQGTFCSIKTPSIVRRGDKLYKEITVEN